MSEQIKIKADKDKISEYIINFEKGLIQVPAFQRDFVWTNEKKLDLFDSIKKGYPIGSVLLWRPLFDDEKFYEDFSGDRLGSYNIPTRSANSWFILDGFQRLSTLIGCLLNPQKAKDKGLHRDEKEWLKEFNIIYNLKDEQFEINRSSKEFYQIPIYKLVDGKEFFQFQKKLFDEDTLNAIYIERYEEISLIFQNYELPNINVYGGSITEAIDIFQRLNSTGAPITTDWVINARAMGKDLNFRLGDKIDNLLENDLTTYNFQNVKRLVILQCITNSFGGVYFDQISKNNNKKLEILVDKPEFIPVTEKTFLSIEKAVKFLFEELIVLDAKYVPYNTQIIFITDFFNKVDSASSKQIYELKRWFWITSYSNYFTIYNLSKQRIAYNKFQEFIKNENEDPVYYDQLGEFITLEFPEKIEMGSVRKKTLALFLANYSVNLGDILRGQRLASDDISSIKSHKLFKDFNTSENAIFVVEKYNSIDNFPKSLKDLSFMLSYECKGKYEEYFINDEMRLYYNRGELNKVLEIRKELIINAEKSFVESLGITYSGN